ncbi:hypothetical protein OCU04_011280 [Sclerotinia nivalis]|uniref:Uncharacterized protein n=1 Tax=Sclerotinia nivalis TaxID=352851 RepID=A0A9X0DG99_9HELO|nr:hypothetical protein OCU04_011280 [Sclerotinia nivalis]
MDLSWQGLQTSLGEYEVLTEVHPISSLTPTSIMVMSICKVIRGSSTISNVHFGLGDLKGQTCLSLSELRSTFSLLTKVQMIPGQNHGLVPEHIKANQVNYGCWKP